MTFFSLTFLLIFLPVSLLLYYTVPVSLKNPVLLLLSLAFYGLLEPRFFWLMLFSLLFDYGAACIVCSFRDRSGIGRLACFLSAVKSAAYVAYGVLCIRQGSPSPAGILIFTWSATGYVVDLYHKAAPFERNFLDFALYNCFFGRIFLGPYVKYTVIRPQLKEKRLSLASISSGMVLLVQGMAKKVVLGDSLMGLYQTVSAIEERERTLLSSWTLLLSLALGVYFVFSGYCDAARGLGHIFSFKMPRNIFFPLHTGSVREFVERFNISWLDYLRRYIGYPLAALHGSAVWQGICTAVCLAFYGAWLSLTPRGILWGGFLALLMLSEKYLYGKLLEKLPHLLRRLYAGLAVLLSFALLSQPSLHSSYVLIKTLFQFEAGLWYNDAIVYILLQNYWALALGLLLSYPMIPRVSSFIRKRWPACANIFSVALNLGLITLTIMFLI
ncbi:MAG: hypothetical protein HFG26_00345 [Provencibacterium sp.]|jgi:alginate O-acetyltransferase complex protein AlgI|nr:hypothetical protein [Provencibacterium sp.]